MRSDTDMDDMDRTPCTIMECSGDPEYAYWMPDLGQFSRAQDPEHDLLDDGDLAPYVCESCRDRMAASPHWDAEQFVNPREKLIADGGVVEAAADGECQNPDCPEDDVEPIEDPYYDATIWVCPACKWEVQR
jgi:hypothetical protein